MSPVTSAISRVPSPLVKSKQPQNTLGIENAEVTHVWTDNPEDAKHVAEVAEIENIVSDPKDVIGEVDAVLVATDIGSEHVARCQPFIDADVPIFIDKPLCDNLSDLEIFQKWIDEGKNFISSSAMRYCKEYEPYHQSTHELGDLRYVNVTMAKSWEKYGIHALETVYPIVGPGFESIQELSGLLSLCHRSNIYSLMFLGLVLWFHIADLPFLGQIILKFAENLLDLFQLLYFLLEYFLH